MLTIGALDASDNAWVGSNGSGSNHGSSVGMSAPGTNIEVMPDGNNPQGRRATGTSFASPIVAATTGASRLANCRAQISVFTRGLAPGGYLLQVLFKADRAASTTHTLKLDPPLR